MYGWIKRSHCGVNHFCTLSIARFFYKKSLRLFFSRKKSTVAGYSLRVLELLQSGKHRKVPFFRQLFGWVLGVSIDGTN